MLSLVCAVFFSIVLFPFAYAQVNLVPFVESVSVVEEAFRHWHCSVQEGTEYKGHIVIPLA